MDASSSHASPALPVPQTRKAIEDEIARYLNHVFDLRTRLNTFAPISVLPPEVLSEVFMRTAGPYASLPWTTRPYEWIRISHVCRHWRNVALGCPALWGQLVVTTRHEWTEELLERAKKAPLYVTVDLRTAPAMSSFRAGTVSPKEESLALVLSHMSRVRSLSITTSGERPLTAKTLQLLDGPAPCLESLTVRCGDVGRTSPGEYDHIHHMLHHPETGRLRHLELQAVSLHWHKTSLPHLTHLTISNKPHQFRTYVAPETMLAAIAQMHHLEELVIESALTVPADYNQVPMASTQASLPNLWSLRISDTTPNTICLLNHLTTPALSRIFVEVDSNCTRQLRGDLLAAIAAKTSSLGTLLSFVVTLAHVSITLQAYRRGFGCEAMKNGASRPKEHTPELEVRFGRFDVEVVITKACELFPIRDVQHLFVSGTSLSKESWLALLRSTRKVTELSIMDGANDDPLPEVLTDRPRGRKKKAYVLPQLRHLILEDCYFGDHSDEYEYGGDEELEDQDRLAGRLLDCFMARYEYGVEIEQLHIIRPINIFWSEIDELKEVVRYVDWDETIEYDEKERFTDDSYDDFEESEIDPYEDDPYEEDLFWGYGDVWDGGFF
ncbi:uncharacterized protein B0H18DRAFT_328960 [Fomitopsis serialis]|uniref:uncharacterized protein n=1 Tax=Fomitopsis serialis TaxID=139415 RepID=UPI0020086549|nr:uncharacterized protein B0H18DRAFT_328960 [Neoantrodia serialis]KAH9936666.1 hypothetical protein B0H18DRAFT_328960 [Neoantrodia serialis]